MTRLVILTCDVQAVFWFIYLSLVLPHNPYYRGGRWASTWPLILVCVSANVKDDVYHRASAWHMQKVSCLMAQLNPFTPKCCAGKESSLAARLADL